jgi:hypothetical protein
MTKDTKKKKKTSLKSKPASKLKIHHRSSPGPDTREPWERGGFKNKAEYDKLPEKYKKMLR